MDEQLEIEIDLASVDWEEIPTADLLSCCNEARRRAGAFMPTNGLVASVYRGLKENAFEQAARAIRDENTKKYLAAPSDDLPTPEQREEIAAGFRELRKNLFCGGSGES